MDNKKKERIKFKWTWYFLLRVYDTKSTKRSSSISFVPSFTKTSLKALYNYCNEGSSEKSSENSVGKNGKPGQNGWICISTVYDMTNGLKWYNSR